MRHTADFSAFGWPRGKPHLWRISVDRRGRREALLVYGEGWPLPFENAYEPLKHEPHVYVAFAELGRRAIEAGRRRHQESLKYVRDLESGGGPQHERDLVAYAEGDGSIQRAVLSFVQSYGAPRNRTDQERTPRLFAGVRKWLAGVPLTAILTDAWALYSVEHALAEFTSEEDSPSSDVPLEMTQEMAGRLGGFRLAPLPDGPRYTCDSLLDAMWLQMHDAVMGGRWRFCKGCGHLFAATDRRQNYHDVACRNRTHARLYGRKKEG